MPYDFLIWIAMHDNELTLETYLLNLKGESVWYFPDLGNGRDSLSTLATYGIFRQAGLDYVIINRRNILTFGLNGKVI